jgi:hypothetical protein
MVVKIYSIFQVFARRKEESTEEERTQGIERQITRKEWINADRIVMLILVVGVIIGAIIFS